MKGLINEKQTRRQLHIGEDQWVELLAWGVERGMLDALSVVSGQMVYGFVKPRGTTPQRQKQTAVEKTVRGAGADAPKQRGRTAGVGAGKPRGTGSSNMERRKAVASGRARKGRRGVK